jgi:hypothetical protein
MANDIQKTENSWLAYGIAATARWIVGTLLKFSKGDFVAGADDEVIPIGTEMVADMESLAIGFVRWENNAPTEQRMGLVADGFTPAKRDELGDDDPALWEADDEGPPRDPWQFTNYMILHRKSDSKIFTFVTSSRGGLSAIGELCKIYGKQMRRRPDQFPVIVLEVGSYMHREKSYGRIKFPIFKIIGWTDKKPYADPNGDDMPLTAPTSADDSKATKAESPDAEATAEKPKIENAAPRF